jgi:hypothetical protein
MEESRDQLISWEEASSVGNKALYQFLRRAYYPDKIPRKAPLDMREHRHRVAPCGRGSDNDALKLLMSSGANNRQTPLRRQQSSLTAARDFHGTRQRLRLPGADGQRVIQSKREYRR